MKPFITTCIVGDGRYAVNKKSQRRTELFTVQYYTPEKIDLCILRYRILETDVVSLPQNEGRRSQ